MAHKKLPVTAKRKMHSVQSNPELPTIKQDAADQVPFYIPEIKATIMAKPDADRDELRAKYINIQQLRLNKGGVQAKKGFIKF